MNTNVALQAHAWLARIEHAPSNIVDLTDALLNATTDANGPLRLTWDPTSQQVHLLDASGSLFPISWPKSVFRAILARLAAICNEQKPNSVSPYGGEGEIATNGSPSVKIHFENTTDRSMVSLNPN